MPGLAARMTHRYISNPRVKKLRQFEEDILDQSERRKIQFNKFSIQGYAWGEQDRPTALLVHGWEGQAGNFGFLTDLVLSKGYRVIAYDAPSHGKSSKATTTMFEYADFITERVREHKPSLILSHSFGTVTTLFGLKRNSDFHLKQWIIITTPFNFKDHIYRMKARLGINEKTLKKLINLLEKDTEHVVDELNMGVLGPQVSNYDSCTIIHSADDKVIPFQDAVNTNQYLAKSELLKVNGLGHYRILWSEELKAIMEEKLINANKN